MLLSTLVTGGGLPGVSNLQSSLGVLALKSRFSEEEKLFSGMHAKLFSQIADSCPRQGFLQTESLDEYTTQLFVRKDNFSGRALRQIVEVCFRQLKKVNLP